MYEEHMDKAKGGGFEGGRQEWVGWGGKWRQLYLNNNKKDKKREKKEKAFTLHLRLFLKIIFDFWGWQIFIQKSKIFFFDMLLGHIIGSMEHTDLLLKVVAPFDLLDQKSQVAELYHVVSLLKKNLGRSNGFFLYTF